MPRKYPNKFTDTASAQAPTIFVLNQNPSEAGARAELFRASGFAVELHASGRALLSSLTNSRHGCVVLDLELPWSERCELQAALHDRDHPLPMVVLTGSREVLEAVAMMQRGLAEMLPQACSAAELCEAVDRSLVACTQRKATAQARARWATLTPRERDVCRLLGDGLIDKQVAAELGTTRSTVQLQRARAFEKLGVSSAAELVRVLVALERGA
ncbi:Response regulator protein TodT [Enhygromyxa salina]|uniref:Response regulator protein TodT n=1 Tax=Enhygromyxa salina TaxID=215803 RepID=A0A2S9YGP1_9BACT|nr:LuxR C-terminal-related transcriptional regulator [Enhygromyxa salina]PRQ04269.1 Response regulator protein TodT [Enhygromyxa salina]